MPVQDDVEKLQQPPAEEDFSGWTDDPLLLRAAPLPSLRMQQGVDPCAIRINDGRCVIIPHLYNLVYVRALLRRMSSSRGMDKSYVLRDAA